MASVYHVFRFLLFFHFVIALLSAGYGNGTYYDKCPKSFDCGNLGSLHFPFTKLELPHCGFFAVRGCDDGDPSSDKKVQLDKNGKSLLLKKVLQQQHNKNITVFFQDNHDEHLKSTTCEVFDNKYDIAPLNTPNSPPLPPFKIKPNLILFPCTLEPPDSCPDYHDYRHLLHSHPHPHDMAQSSLPQCSTLQLPCKDMTHDEDLGFSCGKIDIEVGSSVDCDNCTGGQCLVDDHNNFSCVKEKDHRWLKLGFGLGLGAAIVGAFVLIIYWFRRTLFWKNKSKAHQDFEAFLKSYGSLATKRYSYSEIKKMTNCFKEKLGQGGYGSVFKGSLHDKCSVAVKVLKETEGDGEEFINEVASISKTSHVNIVTLLGFCLEGSKKALVYEFMANGSLEKFIFEKEADLLEGNLQLSWEILHQISVGVARGLEYLHRGCNTRIFHFDIKPHNILLDENFYPKISDFGLAKICLGNESVVSMTVARGTIGYIAPEVISRSFGVVSQKSDVYSFGMMVLEMVGGRRNVNVSVDDTSEIYFPHWIYKRLELDEELALRSIRKEGDKERIKQMVITSLWCIQTSPSERPIMSKVVEMLEGRGETLQVPPKPCLLSPSRSPCHSSSSTR